MICVSQVANTGKERDKFEVWISHIAALLDNTTTSHH